MTTDAAGDRTTVSTSADGPAIDDDRPTALVVGLGDSVMFGWGVDDQETYLSLLLQALQRDAPDIRWQVRNTGVPGYNTTNEIARLTELIEQGSRPDLVILGFVGNDLDVSDFQRSSQPATTLHSSFLITLARTGSLRRTINPPMLDAFWSRLEPNSSELARVAPVFRPQLGLRALQAKFRELGELRAQHGFDVLVLTHGSIPKFLPNEAERNSFNLVSTMPTLQEAAGAGSWHKPPLARSETDRHPSALAHRLIADLLGRSLKTSEILPRVLDRIRGRRSASSSANPTSDPTLEQDAR